MSPRLSRLRGALSLGAARVIGSRFAKPVARAVLVAAALVLLAVIGHASAAGAFGPSAVAASVPVDASVNLGLAAPTAPGPPAPAAGAPTPPPTSTPSPAPTTSRRASPDDPVVLNTATAEDLRRLPGIGQKRADAILALRTHLGRFRAIEELLKVKGVGRATLKRLRPLVRLEAPPSPDAGATATR